LLKTLLKFRKTIGLLLYRLAYGVHANFILISFINVGVFVMHKYVDIIVDTLIFGDKLFNQYILYFIMCAYLGSHMGFFYACGLPNVYATIDGSHISFSQKPNKHVITILANYYYYKLKNYNNCLTNNL